MSGYHSECQEKEKYHLLKKRIFVKDRSSHWRCPVKKVFLKFRKKHLRQSLFLNNVAGLASAEHLPMIISHTNIKEARLRQSISPSKRLCVTLRYLGTGEPFVTIGISNVVEVVKLQFSFNESE